MIEGNPYTVIAQRVRRRFRPEIVGGKPVEVIDMATGEVTVGTQIVGRQKVYDSSDFIKFYNPSALIGLSTPAVALFAYIASNLQFGGVVTIDHESAAAFTGYKSRKSLWSGMAELIEKDIIRKKSGADYWVNPNIMYRGQRDEFTLE